RAHRIGTIRAATRDAGLCAHAGAYTLGGAIPAVGARRDAGWHAAERVVSREGQPVPRPHDEPGGRGVDADRSAATPHPPAPLSPFRRKGEGRRGGWSRGPPVPP